MRIIDRIENLLLERGVDRRRARGELAEVCGITYQAVAQWYSSTKKISPEHLAAIAKKWDTTTDYLITGQEPPTITGLPEYDLLSPRQKEIADSLIRDLANQ